MVVAIGTSIILGIRDARLTDLPVVTTANETITSVKESCKYLTNTWVKSIGTITNATSADVINSGNYTTTIVNGHGTGKICAVNANPYNNTNWNVTYTWYNTSRADWSVANQSALGLGEYGNWYKIIILVGIAAGILAIIFSTFGSKNQTGATSY
jgi:hypothetical protein